MVEFNDILASQQAGWTNQRDDTHARRSLQQELERISGDPTGAQPEDFLEDDIVTICQDFMGAASVAGWRGSDEMNLLVSRSGGYVWSRPDKYPPHPGRERLFMRPVWEGRGYNIGGLVVGGTVTQESVRPSVALCTDGLLRCWRSPRLFSRSYGMGYGRLPDIGCVTVAAPEPFAVSLANKLRP